MLFVPHGQAGEGAEGVPNLQHSQDIAADFNQLARALIKAKRVAVVCGAGISCAAGIPDFRSSAGLFQTLKEQNPQARLASGKDLFDASLFQSEANTSLFYTMIAELCELSSKAEPTSFHRLLKWLDDHGKLMRVYTQNIDGLEQKAGLTFGLGERETGKPRTPARKKRKLPSNPVLNIVAQTTEQQLRDSSVGSTANKEADIDSTKSGKAIKAAQIPRVIPLHGSLHTMQCTKCHQTEQMMGNLQHQSMLRSGKPIPCQSCQYSEQMRSATNERRRGVGLMKPNVVLYGEQHAGADIIGGITEKDLMGARPDLLLVCGTSLKVPGTKRLVRELAKVTNPSAAAANETNLPETVQGAFRARTIFLNLDFPTQAREWAGLFDVWLKADVQLFAEKVMEESANYNKSLSQQEFKRARQAEKRRMLAIAAQRNKENVVERTLHVQAAPQPFRKPGYEMVLMDGHNVFEEPVVVSGKRQRRAPSTYSAKDFVVPASRVLHVRPVPVAEATFAHAALPFEAEARSSATPSLISASTLSADADDCLPQDNANEVISDSQASNSSLGSSDTSPPFEVRISPVNISDLKTFDQPRRRSLMHDFFPASKTGLSAYSLKR